MATHSATITFARAGVHAPVYVVTSLSEPPWKALEMKFDAKKGVYERRFEGVGVGDYQYKIRIGGGGWVLDEERDTAVDGQGNRNNVIHVRRGEGRRGVDGSGGKKVQDGVPRGKALEGRTERKDSTTNSNGQISGPIPLVVVDKVKDKEQPRYGDTESHPLAENDAKRASDFQPDVEETHKEAPVDKTADKKQPTTGDTEPHSLADIDAERAAHPQFDVENTHEEAPAASEVSSPSEVPFLLVEKTDNRPAYGDDFGDKATPNQKVAYDKRAADALPNKLIITPEGHVEPGTEEEQAAPLFRHESVQLDEPPKKSPTISALDTIEEGSNDSSTGLSSDSRDVFNTPSDSNESHYEESFKERSVARDADPTPLRSELGDRSSSHKVESEENDDDELHAGPLLPHETGLSDIVDDEGDYEGIESAEDDEDELGNGPLLSHETGLKRTLVDDEGDYEAAEEDGEDDELHNGPLLSHETGLKYPEEDDDEEVDELDLAPLLSHETGFSKYGDSKTTTTDSTSEDAISEPRHYAYDDDDDDEGYVSRPLQPNSALTFSHEQLSEHEDDYDYDDAPLLPHERGDSAIASESGTEDDAEPTFPYERTDSRNMYGGVGRPSFFRQRTSSSTLPHRLPRSDADDENLNDPSLERFPTNREQILQRVATIGLQLPEDEYVEDDLRSPGMSVMSQACSSVDLAAVKSYTSLASVPEADDSDEDEEPENDRELESIPNSPSSPMVMQMPRGVRDFARDPRVTPKVEQQKQIGVDEDQSLAVPHGQANRDMSREEVPNHLDEAPAKTSIPPLTLAPTITTDPGEVRQRNVSKQDESPRDIASQQLDQPSPTEPFLQNFLRVVFGGLGRFLTACLGDRKRAG